MTQLTYRWTLTPFELFECFMPLPDARLRSQPDIKPFSIPKQKLEDTAFDYQLGLGTDSLAEDVRLILAANLVPAVPREKRSGILVFHQDEVIASFMTPGTGVRTSRHVFVSPKHRELGLGKRMVEQWFRQVPRVLGIPKQPISRRGAATFLGAHEQAVRWAIRQGYDVPERVRSAVRERADRKLILDRFKP